MIAQITINTSQAIEIDLSKPIDISIPIEEGANNPNCYWAEEVTFETISANGFVGSIKEGGPVNYQKLTLTPHGNGTHIECYGHITDSGATVQGQLKQYHHYAKLISIQPEKAINGDWVLNFDKKLDQLNWEGITAIIIRTLPNTENKLTQAYSGTNPAYVSHELIQFIVDKNIEHLLIDLPSLDKEVDGGALVAHRRFWGLPHKVRTQATISELVYVPSSVPDQNYFLNLQTISLKMDAAPCKPVLYSIEKIIPLKE